MLSVHNCIPIIQAVSLTALQSFATRVIAIVNLDCPGVYHSLEDLDIKVVGNKIAWGGKSNSFPRKVSALKTLNLDSCIILLGHMPGIQSKWIDKVLDYHLSSQVRLFKNNTLEPRVT